MAVERNVGGADQVIRILVGSALVLVALFAELSPAWRTLAWIGAVAALVTAIGGFCPINKALGVNTCTRQ